MEREPWNILDSWNVIFIALALLALLMLRGRGP